MGREIKTLEDVDVEVIRTVFNKSFSNYFIPFKLTTDQLIQKMKVDRTDLNLSVGVFENNKMIGFILHGFDIINDQRVVYNGGTGVIPEKRGSGLTQQMYQFILPVLKKKGINKLVLEVIKENIQALTSYKRVGFKVKRELLCYNGEIKTLDTIKRDIEIKELPNYNWNLLESFWDIQPTWQNSRSVINELKHHNVSLGAYHHNQLVGYLFYNPTNNRILQIGVNKNSRQQGIASLLISELIKSGSHSISIINVERLSKGTNEFLTRIGLKCNLVQFEMEFLLDDHFYKTTYTAS